MVISEDFNVTKAAQEPQAEPVWIICDTAMAAQYMQNWHAHLHHSQSYVGRGIR
jgi:hypothetical protein